MASSAAIRLLLCLLFIVASVALSSSAAPAPGNRTFTFLIDDCCGPVQSTFLRTLSLPDPSVNRSLTLNLTASDAESTVAFTQWAHDPSDDNVDSLSADPTPGHPAFLTAHGDFKLVQYVESPLNLTLPSTSSTRRPTPAVHLSDAMPYPQADLPGVGLYYVEERFLFRLDLKQRYYSVAFIDVEGPSKTDFVLMVFTDPDRYDGSVTAARPTFQDVRSVPADSYPGLSCSKAAVNQQAGLIYLSVVFWQASETQYDEGWVWTFDVRQNAIVSEVAWPANTTGYLDTKTELVWSELRQTLYGASFDEGAGFNPTLRLDSVNPDNGTAVRIGSQANVIADDYDMVQALDDESGWWYMASSDYSVLLPDGLPWLLYSINVDTGLFGATHHLNVPFFILGMSFIPPTADRAAAQLAVEQPTADERVSAAQRKLNERRRLQSQKRTQRVSLPSITAQQ